MQDAGEMYERGGMFEKAASIYIQNKNFQQVAPLMAKISSPKLHLQYAKAKEGEGKFQEAAAAYEVRETAIWGPVHCIRCGLGTIM